MATVVVASYFEDEYVRQIRDAGGDKVRILYREDLVPPPRFDGDHIGPENWRRTPEGEREFVAMLEEAEVLLDFPRGHLEDLTKVAPNLRWVQGSMAGAGEVAEKAGLLETDIIVTTASGVFSGTLAEFSLAAMLAHAKNLEGLRRNKEKRLWREVPVATLEEKTLCVVGMGSIGQAVAERARPFGMRVLGVKRTVRDGDPARGYADVLYETGRLQEALAEADYVVVTLPNTPETRHLLDSGAIAAIKRGAYFINVGRGQVVDEEALVEALEDGHLAGAALDVFETEPLPQESPLWRLENVIISPHATDNVPGYANRRLTELFCKNLRRYLAGDEMINVLDKRLLY